MPLPLPPAPAPRRTGRLVVGRTVGGQPIFASLADSAAVAERAAARHHLADCAQRDPGQLGEHGWSTARPTGSAAVRLDAAELALAEATRAKPAGRRSAAQENFETAQRLGVLDPLLSERAHDEWLVEPSPQHRALANRLRALVFMRAQTANAPGYHAELAGALVWLADFLEAMPGRLFLKRPLDDGDKIYNAGSLSLMFEFMREKGSRKPGAKSFGKTLKSNTISGTLSTLTAFLSFIAKQPLVDKDFCAELSAAKKQARHEDGPAGATAVEDPLRAMHLRAAFATGFCRPRVGKPTALQVVKRAALLGGHNLLARGTCLCETDERRMLSIVAFDWRAAAELSPPGVVVWLHPSKDPTQRKPRYPMLVQRRAVGGARSADPMCTFDAFVDAWKVLAATVPLHRHRSTIFFRVPPDGHDVDLSDAADWPPLTPALVSVWVKEAAVAAGVDPTRRGTRALRMGGSTDLYDIYGPAAERYIRERGRWGSDVAQIYQRVSAAAHGEMSRVIGDSDGADLQSLLRGWSQLAVSHGRCPV